MADMYDDISIFRHSPFLRPPPFSSSSSPMASSHNDRQISSSNFPQTDMISAAASSSSSSFCFPLQSSGANLSSSVHINNFSSDFDAYDYEDETEEGVEMLVEETPAKPRSSSKRTRAAEVHNLSEKRRRSRINEKMKALQNLIPNSNKTDKASMLDEAIEYLKQLQLQVQMLSMSNGLSLHPMCQPGLRQPIQPSQTRMAYSERNQLPLHANVSNINQVSQSQSLFSLPSQYGLSENSTIPSLLGVINPKTLFELEASLQAELEPLQIHSASKEKCSEISLPHQQSEIKMGAVGTVPIPCNAPSTNAKGCGSLQSCILGIDQSKEVLLKNIESSQILLQHSNSVHEGAIAAKAIAKMGPEF